MWQYAFCVTWLRTRVLLELRMRCANRTTVYRWGGGAAVCCITSIARGACCECASDRDDVFIQERVFAYTRAAV